MRPDAITAVHAVGRERELDAMLELLGDGSSPHALVLTGEPGIGKTTLWETVLAAAANSGLRVLAARAGEAEARLSFVGLADLLDDVASDELAALPSPQRRALEIALLRAEPTGTPPGEQAIALGFLNALRSLAARAPVLVAVDDAPWLDGASADALAFAARRLGREPVSFIISRRLRSEAAVEGALHPITRFELAGLSIGATRRMLSDRLGLVVSRRVLQRVTELTGGNPLFALEVARTLADRDPLEIGDEIPVPATVDDLLGLRVTQLEATVRRVVLAVALSGGLSVADCALFATDEQLTCRNRRRTARRRRRAHPCGAPTRRRGDSKALARVGVPAHPRQAGGGCDERRDRGPPSRPRGRPTRCGAGVHRLGRGCQGGRAWRGRGCGRAGGTGASALAAGIRRASRGRARARWLPLSRRRAASTEHAAHGRAVGATVRRGPRQGTSLAEHRSGEHRRVRGASGASAGRERGRSADARERSRRAVREPGCRQAGAVSSSRRSGRSKRCGSPADAARQHSSRRSVGRGSCRDRRSTTWPDARAAFRTGSG